MARKKNVVPEEPQVNETEQVSGETQDVAQAKATEALASPMEATDDTGRVEDEKTKLSLSLPLEPFEKAPGSLDRLRAAIQSKKTLLKKALATDSLDFQVEDDRLVFPWFTIVDEKKSAEETKAYSQLVFALAKKALTQKRVSSEEKLNPDERQGMRLYLISLDFIGDEYKETRAILMRNFSGTKGASQPPAEFHLDMPEVYVKPGS